MLVTGAVGVLIGVLASHRKVALAGVAVGSLLIHPLVAVALGATAFGVVRWRAIRRHKRRAQRGVSDVLLALDLMALATTSGLPFTTAATMAVHHVGEPTRGTLEQAVRRVDAGLGHDLDDGPLADAFNAAQRSAVTGASLSVTLADLAQRAREDEAAVTAERLEKLPVKLLFPMAFLILPGFILVVVVPTIVSGLAELTR